MVNNRLILHFLQSSCPFYFFLMLIYHKQYRITGAQYGGGGGGVKKNIRKGKLKLNEKKIHARQLTPKKNSC